MSKCVFLNPRTCGIYKNGGPRYRTDASTGRRTDEIDNELKEHVAAYLAGRRVAGMAKVSVRTAFQNQNLVPTYYDERYNASIRELVDRLGVETISVGDMLDEGWITVRGGHGSPGNDQRSGIIPYIKVSDIRGMRVNINPTNLVPESVAKRLWRADSSGLQAWDLITPNRASSNIGEFAVLLPSEEQIVVTKEVFVFRVVDETLFNHFYLLWALSLKAVREQWRRVALMQTNREDCGSRYKEILLPKPPSAEWAEDAAKAFQEYFSTIADAKPAFLDAIASDGNEYIPSVYSSAPIEMEQEDGDEIQ
jgi:type I restriction enzyme M protein